MEAATLAARRNDADPLTRQTEPAVENEKFHLVADIGRFTVPKGYDQAKWLESGRKKLRRDVCVFEEELLRARFHPSHVLEAGQKLRVRVFGNSSPSGRTMSEDRIAFIEKQGGVHVGLQGTILVFRKKRKKLPEGYSFLSYDKPDRLWCTDKEGLQVPVLSRLHVGTIELSTFEIGLRSLAMFWDDKTAFFVFNMIQPKAPTP